ncbi:hypothetical protein BC830DRAFT_1094093 [Chytriomyces sp. MP71]|nr:hypothetical protein BC830DRAFT_1094093 [Chytriomyces sp. MP71]
MYAALIKAHAILKNPADADLIYRDLRLAGLPATGEVYAQLINAHSAAGNVTAASRYFHKRQDVVTTNITNSAVPNDASTTTPNPALLIQTDPPFHPTKVMHAAMVRAYAHNAELATAWRALSSGWSQIGGLRFPTLRNRDFAADIARHYVAQPSSASAIAEAWKAAGTVKGAGRAVNDTTGPAWAGAIVCEGLLILLKEEGVDRAAVLARLEEILQALREPDGPLSFPTKFKLIETYKERQLSAETLERLKYKFAQGQKSFNVQIAHVRMHLALEKADLAAAQTVLEETVKNLTPSTVVLYLRVVADAVEAGKITKQEEAAMLVAKGVAVVQKVGVEARASLMNEIVRASKSDATAKCGVAELTLKEAVEAWVKAGGVFNKDMNAALGDFVEKNDIKLLTDSV